MPNWVRNDLRVEKQFLFRIVNKKDEVDFNLAKPMPQTLNCEASSTNDLAVYYYLSNRNTMSVDDMKKSQLVNTLINNSFNNDWIGEVEKRVTVALANNTYDADKLFEEGKNLVNNYNAYGATTWYEWSIANWGCKWNADTESIEDDPDDNDFVIITFSTPWSAPGGWLEALADMKIPFRCEWHEEQGYHGEFVSDGSGEMEDNELEFEGFDDDDEDDDGDEENDD